VQATNTGPPAGFFGDVLSIFRMFNRVCWIVWIVLALMNFTWGLAAIYIPTFMGMSILHGDPAAPPDSKAAMAYDTGAAELASLALWGQAFLCVVVAPVFPFLARHVGESRTWAACFVFHGLILCGTVACISDPFLVVSAFSLQGIPWAAFMVIPYAITGREAQRTRVEGHDCGSEALFVSVMNLSLCVGNFIGCLVSGVATVVTGGAAGPLFMAGLLAFLSAAALFMGLKDENGMVVERA